MLDKKFTILRFDEMDSTNLFLKMYCSDHVDNTIFIVKNQTLGKGRLGRNFFCYEGGLYFSILKKNYKSEVFPLITSICAYVVSTTINEMFNLHTTVKWVNDIMLGDKKVCGILCESTTDQNGKTNVVIGIGINVLQCNTFPYDLKQIATTLTDSTDESIKEELFERIITKLDSSLDCFTDEMLSYLRDNSYLQDKEVIINTFSKEVSGKVLGIDENCNLIIKNEQNILHISSGMITRVIAK